MRIQAIAVAMFLSACGEAERTQPPAETVAAETPAPPSQAPADLAPERPAKPREVPVDGAMGFDVKARYPLAWGQWKDSLSDLRFAEAKWLYDLEGTADPISEITVGGRRYHRAWVCEPHNCGNNQTTLLIAPDQSRIVGLVQITDEVTRVATRTPIGAPNSGELACLARLMDDVNEDRC